MLKRWEEDLVKASKMINYVIAGMIACSEFGGSKLDKKAVSDLVMTDNSLDCVISILKDI